MVGAVWDMTVQIVHIQVVVVNTTEEVEEGGESGPSLVTTHTKF